MEDFTTLIAQLIESIDLTIPVREIDVNRNRVYLCKTLFLTTKYKVTDSERNEYQVTDWSNNEWVELSPIGASPDPFNDVVIECPEVYYLHGTPISVNSEFMQLDGNVPDKTPLVWLNENYREELPGRGSSIEREVTPDLFFIDEQGQSFTNADHHRFVIQPMLNLYFAFVEAVKEDRRFKRIDTTMTIPRSRFGVYFENRGNERKIIDAPLSAVQVQPTLIKYKEACNCY